MKIFDFCALVKNTFDSLGNFLFYLVLSRISTNTIFRLIWPKGNLKRIFRFLSDDCLTSFANTILQIHFHSLQSLLFCLRISTNKIYGLSTRKFPIFDQNHGLAPVENFEFAPLLKINIV